MDTDGGDGGEGDDERGGEDESEGMAWARSMASTRGAMPTQPTVTVSHPNAAVGQSMNAAIASEECAGVVCAASLVPTTLSVPMTYNALVGAAVNVQEHFPQPQHHFAHAHASSGQEFDLTPPSTAANPPITDDHNHGLVQSAFSLASLVPSAHSSVADFPLTGNSTCGGTGCADPECSSIEHRLRLAKMTADLLLKAVCDPQSLTAEEQQTYQRVLAARAQAMLAGEIAESSGSEFWGSGSECTSLSSSPMPMLSAPPTLLERSSLSRGPNKLFPPASTPPAV